MINKGRVLFSSESVTEGHPDKMADQISDAVVDAILDKDPNGRIACETMLTTGLVIVGGEITTDCYIDIPNIVRDVVKEIGYTRAKYGFDYETCGVITSIHESLRTLLWGLIDPWKLRVIHISRKIGHWGLEIRE